MRGKLTPVVTAGVKKPGKNILKTVKLVIYIFINTCNR